MTTTPAAKSGMRRALVESQILEVSAELFAARGFQATGLQDVAAVLGVSRPALYHYFGSKEEILARLSEEMFEAANAGVVAALKVKGPADVRLSAFMDALLIPVADSPGRFRLFQTRDDSIPAEQRARFEELEQIITSSLISIIKKGVADGVFRRCNPPIVCAAILGVINWVAWWYTPESSLTVEQLREGLLDFALSSLRAGAVDDSGTVFDALNSIRREVDYLQRELEAGTPE